MIQDFCSELYVQRSPSFSAEFYVGGRTWPAQRQFPETMSR